MTRREHTTELTLPAPPAEVWKALTEAGLLQTWYAPEVRIDPKVGGEYVVSWGEGMEGGGTISAFEPEKHLGLVNERRIPAEGEPVRMAIDFFLTGKGGETHLRLVHSGFLATSDWDNEYNGTKMGWPIMLRLMRYGLVHHRGVPGRQRWLYASAPLSVADAWHRVADLFRGTVPEFSTEPSEFCAAWKEPGDGVIYAAFAEKKGKTVITFCVVLYGDAAERIDAAAADWQVRLDSLGAQAG